MTNSYKSDNLYPAKCAVSTEIKNFKIKTLELGSF